MGHFSLKGTSMASFSHHVKTGRKAVERSNYINRRGMYQYKDDLVAGGFGGMPKFAESNPRQFWDAAQKTERKGGAVIKEHTFSLSNELSLEQNIEVTESIVSGLAGDKPYEWAMHAPHASLGEATNLHVHMLMSDRVPDGIERPAELICKRYNPAHPELGGRRKDTGGKTFKDVQDRLLRERKLVADVINEALARHGHDARVDHRSLKEQGIHRAPERHLGQARIRSMTHEQKREFLEIRASSGTV